MNDPSSDLLANLQLAKNVPRIPYLIADDGADRSLGVLSKDSWFTSIIKYLLEDYRSRVRLHPPDTSETGIVTIHIHHSDDLCLNFACSRRDDNLNRKP